MNNINHQPSTTDNINMDINNNNINRFLWALTLASWFVVIVFWDQLASLANENALIEWAGTLLFGAAAVVFWIAAKRDQRPRRIASIFLGFVFFVAFMEEISWGQQVFKWNTPPAFDSNFQNETNLHNMGGLPFDQQQVFTVGILFLTVVIPLAFLWAPTRRWVNRLGLPVVSLGVTAWVLVNLVIANVAERLMSQSATGPQRLLREFNELMWAVAALLAALAALRVAMALRSEDRSLVEVDR